MIYNLVNNRDLRGAILDFDGFFYKFNASPVKALNQYGVDAVIDLSQDKTIDREDVQKTLLAAMQQGDWIKPFTEEPYAIARDDLYEGYHDRLLTCEHGLATIEECQETAAGIMDLHYANLKMAILTHANRAWAHHALQHLEVKTNLPLTQVFSDDLILTVKDTNFVQKDHCHSPFLQALDAINAVHGTAIAPQQVFVGEDSKRNLRHAHKIGMGTFLATHGADIILSDDERSFIDATGHNVSALVPAIAERWECKQMPESLLPSCP